MEKYKTCKIPLRLADEYQVVFQNEGEIPRFKFLRKYLQYLEEENSCIKHMFAIENTEIEKFNLVREVVGLEKSCVDFLKAITRTKKLRNGRSFYSDGLVFTGICFEMGVLGFKKNCNLSFDYYEAAAKLNNPLGVFRLGQCYEKGIGTPIKIDKALTFYRIAAKLGSVEAMHTYGAIQISGECGVKKDVSAGLFYLQLAVKKADDSYPYPFFDLAKCYDSTLNTVLIREADYAFELYYEGASMGCPNCQHRIAKTYEYSELNIEINLNESVYWYKRAAENGHVDAQLAISSLYFTGIENVLECDSVKAYFWALKAASKGHPNAAYSVGEFVETGTGIIADPIHALWWFSIAANLGHNQANSKIHDLSKFTKIDEKSERKRWFGIF